MATIRVWDGYVSTFQSPSLRGSGRFRAWCESTARAEAEFQSPSLRGSGRFAAPSSGMSGRGAGFNPLHCGAVVASRRLGDGLITHLECFNPLHCGAVVASCACSSTRWKRRWFQSPSLRGSGRFPRRSLSDCATSLRTFQSPSLRGSGRFTYSSGLPAYARSCFNPLHCGAVVASGRIGMLPLTPACFNPLHCGAVVASVILPGIWRVQSQVSIPFIAGQWSLHESPCHPSSIYK